MTKYSKYDRLVLKRRDDYEKGIFDSTLYN